MTRSGRVQRYVEVTVPDWRSFAEIAALQGRHYFRGQSSARWPLASSLEREYNRYKPDRLGSPPNAEHWMLHEFKSKYHLHASSPPPESDDFEWLALMQHHGAPTRLLDFTLSPYIASFFAIEEATEPACVWAISWTSIRDQILARGLVQYDNSKTLRDSVNRTLIEFLNDYIGEKSPRNPPLQLVPVESKRLSARASRQKGLFLAPLSIGWVGKFVPFEGNLAESFGTDGVDFANLERLEFKEFMSTSEHGFWPDAFSAARIILPERVHVPGLRQLVQMGISRESLFPGLDGLARSLTLEHLRLGL